MDLNEAAEIVMEKLSIPKEDAEKILEKAEAGGEITNTFDVEKWLKERFLPNCVFIDEDGYTRMCVDALKILSSTAATDYGSSRQRDMGQLWADMTRGYLGELAFIQFLEQKWGIKGELGHEAGALEDFLPEDIKQIKKPNEAARKPKVKLSIKTTKWNGIWLDIPGDQFNHSDVHVLVKVGAGRDHLFAFFKKISVFKDKVLKRGQDVGVLTADSASELFDKLPSFKPIPAYICGFALNGKKHSTLAYSGKKGRKNYTILSWNGPINPGDIDEIKKREGVAGKVSFEGIGDFAHDKGYLFNTGNLLWKDDDWKSIIEKI
jgi:hypothetical protein